MAATVFTSRHNPLLHHVQRVDYPTIEHVKNSQTDTRHLEVSFYSGKEHLLDLETVDEWNRIFAIALTKLAPSNSEYATIKYEDAFNWSTVMSYVKTLVEEAGLQWTKQEFYVVEFRSRLKTDLNRELLFKLDKMSHQEATESGGLLKYWYGSPDNNRRNLATCLWRSKEDAIRGGKGPWHKQARGVIGAMYEEINVKGLRLTIDDDVGEWHFSPFL